MRLLMVNIISNHIYLQFVSITEIFNHQNHGSISREALMVLLLLFWVFLLETYLLRTSVFLEEAIFRTQCYEMEGGW